MALCVMAGKQEINNGLESILSSTDTMISPSSTIFSNSSITANITSQNSNGGNSSATNLILNPGNSDITSKINCLMTNTGMSFTTSMSPASVLTSGCASPLDTLSANCSSPMAETLVKSSCNTRGTVLQSSCPNQAHIIASSCDSPAAGLSSACVSPSAVLTNAMNSTGSVLSSACMSPVADLINQTTSPGAVLLNNVVSSTLPFVNRSSSTGSILTRSCPSPGNVLLNTGRSAPGTLLVNSSTNATVLTNDDTAAAILSIMPKVEDEFDSISSTIAEGSGGQTMASGEDKTGNNSSKLLHLCGLCDRQFLTSDSLKKHVKTHQGSTCHLCGQSFVDRMTLAKHQVEAHAQEKSIFSCGQCDKTFKEVRTLRLHLKIHNAEYPEQCGVCNKVFRTKWQLKQHVMDHGGERPYPCPECTFTCKTKQQLNEHRRKHSGEKAYSCPLCATRFTYRNGLIKHTKLNRCPKKIVSTTASAANTQKAAAATANSALAAPPAMAVTTTATQSLLDPLMSLPPSQAPSSAVAATTFPEAVQSIIAPLMGLPPGVGVKTEPALVDNDGSMSAAVDAANRSAGGQETGAAQHHHHPHQLPEPMVDGRFSAKKIKNGCAVPRLLIHNNNNNNVMGSKDGFAGVTMSPSPSAAIRPVGEPLSVASMAANRLSLNPQKQLLDGTSVQLLAADSGLAAGVSGLTTGDASAVNAVTSLPDFSKHGNPPPAYPGSVSPADVKIMPGSASAALQRQALRLLPNSNLLDQPSVGNCGLQMPPNDAATALGTGLIGSQPALNPSLSLLSSVPVTQAPVGSPFVRTSEADLTRSPGVGMGSSLLGGQRASTTTLLPLKNGASITVRVNGGPEVANNIDIGLMEKLTGLIAGMAGSSSSGMQSFDSTILDTNKNGAGGNLAAPRPTRLISSSVGPTNVRQPGPGLVSAAAINVRQPSGLVCATTSAVRQPGSIPVAANGRQTGMASGPSSALLGTSSDISSWAATLPAGTKVTVTHYDASRSVQEGREGELVATPTHTETIIVTDRGQAAVEAAANGSELKPPTASVDTTDQQLGGQGNGGHQLTANGLKTQAAMINRGMLGEAIAARLKSIEAAKLVQQAPTATTATTASAFGGVTGAGGLAASNQLINHVLQARIAGIINGGSEGAARAAAAASRLLVQQQQMLQQQSVTTHQLNCGLGGLLPPGQQHLRTAGQQLASLSLQQQLLRGQAGMTESLSPIPDMTSRQVVGGNSLLVNPTISMANNKQPSMAVINPGWQQLPQDGQPCGQQPTYNLYHSQEALNLFSSIGVMNYTESFAVDPNEILKEERRGGVKSEPCTPHPGGLQGTGNPFKSGQSFLPDNPGPAGKRIKLEEPDLIGQRSCGSLQDKISTGQLFSSTDKTIKQEPLDDVDVKAKDLDQLDAGPRAAVQEPPKASPVPSVGYSANDIKWEVLSELFDCFDEPVVSDLKEGGHQMATANKKEHPATASNFVNPPNAFEPEPAIKAEDHLNEIISSFNAADSFDQEDLEAMDTSSLADKLLEKEMLLRPDPRHPPGNEDANRQQTPSSSTTNISIDPFSPAEYSNSSLSSSSSSSCCFGLEAGSSGCDKAIFQSSLDFEAELLSDSNNHASIASLDLDDISESCSLGKSSDGLDFLFDAEAQDWPLTKKDDSADWTKSSRSPVDPSDNHSLEPAKKLYPETKLGGEDTHVGLLSTEMAGLQEKHEEVVTCSISPSGVEASVISDQSWLPSDPVPKSV